MIKFATLVIDGKIVNEYACVTTCTCPTAQSITVQTLLCCSKNNCNINDFDQTANCTYNSARTYFSSYQNFTFSAFANLIFFIIYYIY
jgi:hypothetical protein